MASGRAISGRKGLVSPSGLTPLHSVAVVQLWTLGARSEAVGSVLCRGMGSPEALAFTNSRGLLDENICLGFPGTQTRAKLSSNPTPCPLTSYAIMDKLLNLFGPQFPHL